MLHAGPHAVYLQAGSEVLAVLGRDAVAVPCGVRTRIAALPTSLPGARIGDGRCSIGQYDVVVRRIVDPVVPLLSPHPSAWPAGEHRLLVPALAEIPPEAIAALSAADPAAVDGLLGLGSGLTPTGDDVLAGWLVTTGALGLDTGPVERAVRALAPSRTNTVSATLLAHAADREAIPQVHDLLHALSARTGVDEALRSLLAVGHTSGAGLALGIQTALHPVAATHHLTARSPS